MQENSPHLTDQEDYSVQPMVAEDKSDDEERNSQEDGDASDQVDEVVDFLRDGGLSRVESRGQTGDAAHYLWTKLVFSNRVSNLFVRRKD